MNIKDFFKGDKLFIHMFYWILMLICLCIYLFTVRGYDNTDLSNQFAFGATLSGIILSVLAIMMTLIGEMKSDNTKDTLERVSKQIEEITETKLNEVSVKLEKVTNDLTLSDNSELKEAVNDIRNRIDNSLLNTKGDYFEDTSLLTSYEAVFEYYVLSRDNEVSVCICSILYYLLKGINNYSVIKSSLDINLNNKPKNIEYNIGIALVFRLYAIQSGKFKEYLESKIKETVSQKELDGFDTDINFYT